MQVSVAWLNEWLDTAVVADELATQLTMAGLEVDAITPVAGTFSGVVVGEIIACEKHPEADRLSVCQVSDGGETFQVVCGAPNARAGIKVPFAKVGAVLPDGKAIGQARLRGVESSGMLCGADELGIECDADDGLFVLPPDAAVGEDLRACLDLDDTVLELDLTPNRGDCLGISGLAREVAALNDLNTTAPAMPAVAPTIDGFPVVRIETPACPHYVGRLIEGVSPAAETPLWMRERLRRAGLRSVDAIVDVTNYVMIELGQPMHAFDRAKVAGSIVIRMARTGETLVLIDGAEKALNPDTLIIADDEKPLAIAGVMGGEYSGVSESTRDVLLESAFFDAVALAGKARQYGLHTDSSHRFERGVDPQGQVLAIERATALLLKIAGGKAGPIVKCVHDQAWQPAPAIALQRDAVARVLGVTLSDSDIAGVLTRLGCGLSDTPVGWQVSVPAWRFDISREVDLIEEIARVYGYNRLPVATPRYAMALQATGIVQPDDRYRDALVDRGYREAITYSFVDPAFQQQLLGQAAAVTVQNPIASDMAAMRLSLWPGLLKAVMGNLHRQQQRVRLFELGLVFEGKAANQQLRRIGGVVYGLAQEPHWSGKSRPADFYDVKSDVEALLSLVGLGDSARFEASPHHALHPGQSARILINDQPMGWVGALHPLIQQQLELSGATYLFELCLSAMSSGKLPSFKSLSRFPEMRRDLALVLDSAIPAQAVADAIRQLAGEQLKTLSVFDQFTGAALGNDKKSLGFAMAFQHPERTLTDEEVTSAVERVVQGMAGQFGATVRN